MAFTLIICGIVLAPLLGFFLIDFSMWEENGMPKKCNTAMLKLFLFIFALAILLLLVINFYPHDCKN